MDFLLLNSKGAELVTTLLLWAFVVLLLLWLGRWFFYMVRWAKRRCTGAYLMLAFLPLISLLPIPPTEIKKIQQIKQQQIKQKDEAGEPKKAKDNTGAAR